MYDDHYGFTGRPFQLTPDPRFWFDTAAHRKAMSYLGYGLSQGEGFIVITGDVGAGKTTLVGHLLDKIDRDRLHAISIASTQIEPDDLLRIVATGLDVAQPGATKADLLAAIERGLHAVARTGRRTLLVVDEAQALPAKALEELRLLSNISAGGHALLQIFLLGQPEFRELLEGPGRLEQLRQRVIALHHLDPMGVDEVEPYMAHRLALVGWNGSPRFTGDAFDALHRGSGGVPRLLNQLANRVLLHGSIERIDTIDAAVVEAAMADIARDLPQVREEEPAPTAGRIEWPPTASPLPVAPEVVVPTGPVADEQARLELVDLAARITALEELPDPAEHPAIAQVSELVSRVASLETAPVPTGEELSDLAARITSLEARMEDQDATLRRVLTLLVDWVETDKRPATPPAINLRA